MQAYILESDLDHVDDSGSDVSIIPFDGYHKLRYYFFDPYTYEKELIPSEIICVANFSVLKDIDYLVSDFRVPIMSRRMLDVLLSLSEFSHMVVPLVLIDNSAPPESWFHEDGTVNDSLISPRKFYALRLSEHLDVFDFRNSEYSISRRNPKIPRRVSKFVIHDREGGLPPIFRVSSVPTELLICDSSRSALLSAGIAGLQYKCVDVTPLSPNQPT